MGDARIAPVRAVTPDEVDEFWERGVVCLRGVLPAELLAAMEGPIEETLADRRVTVDIAGLAAGRGADLLVDERAEKAGAPRGQFLSGVDSWLLYPAFERFATRSPLPGIVAALLRSERVWLYEDSVLVKEPGTREETAMHQDLSYFHVEGSQVCTTWAPLDRVDDTTGAVRYVVGSHRWDRSFRPNLFVTTTPLPDTEGEIAPQVGDLGDAEIVSFSTEPGDVVVHHARTLHGASGNASAERRRRAISVRYCGDDARYHIRRGAPLKPHHHNVTEGQPLATDEPACPVVWP
jgi:ectoine hydroxylase-related dioxygenase (phytanoyl-CoA dioxygenase family)